MAHDLQYALYYNYVLLVSTFHVSYMALGSRQGDGGEQHIQRAFCFHQLLLELEFKGDLLPQANEPQVYQWGLSENWRVHLCSRFHGSVVESRTRE